MTTEELATLLTGDYKEVINRVEKTRKAEREASQEIWAKEYNVKDHKTLDTGVRKDKSYEKDKKSTDGDSEKQTVTVPVVRIAIPLQKQIVKIATTFLCGNPIGLSSAPKDEKEKTLLKAVQKIWEDNKLDYKSKSLAKLMMAETEAAEIWYAEETKPEENYWKGILSDNSKIKIRIKIVARSLGDKLYPVFSPEGDMIAFGRGYMGTDETGKAQKRFDIYTIDKIYIGKETQGGWETETVDNKFGKIPVIYYSQDQAEWADVQTLIDRFETQISNLGDTNDYFASPMVVVEGTVKSFAQKGETGKMVEIESGGKLSYATWNEAPASLKLEMETLLKLIFNMTDTPNISFEEMKSLGAFSGIALKMLFMAAHMKASDKEETFGESIQRRINLIIATILNVIDISMKDVRLTIKPRFEYFLPKDDVEKVDNLVTAINAKIMSRETAIRQNPLIQNADDEIVKIQKEEADAEKKKNQGLDIAFNQ